MTRASLDGNAQGPEPRAEDRRPALHQPVLLAEVLELFAGCARPRVVVDGTVGLGGHSAAMLEARGSEIEILIGVDRDPEALAMARDRMKAVGAKTSLLLQQGSYICIPKLLQDEEIPGADFVLLDLGVSTYQLKTPRRGFSLIADGPLDMRMDPGHGSTAAELLERATATELESWLRHYGEVRQAGRIARALWERRSTLRTTGALAAAVLDALRLRRPPPGEIHPATQVFQALRIAVNCELDDLDAVLPDTLQRLAPEGRFAVISFHSLEDRRVKQAFERASKDCLCPPRMPACGCGHHATVRPLTRGAIQASPSEVASNPPSRSARLRAVESLRS